MTSRTLTMLMVLTAIYGSEARAQSAVDRLSPGARIRVEAFGQGERVSGRLVAVDRDSLVMERDGAQISFDLTDLISLQAKTTSGRGALIGALIGSGVGLILATQPGTEAGSSDVAGVAAIGGLVGAAWGGGRRTRVVGGIGLLAGAALGAIAFGTSQSACESGSSTGCHYVYGGAFGASIGLIVGTGIGVLLPNWVSVPLHGIRLGVSGGNQPGFTISWSLGM